MADNEQLTHEGSEESLAGDLQTERLKENAHEAGNQQLTLKRTEEGPILDKRQAVA